jgi:hypothetical protein
MARDAGLALPQDFGQILDRMLALGKQRQQPLAGRFSRGPQRIHQCRGIRQDRPPTRYKDIFMSAALQGFAGERQRPALAVEVH